MRGVHKGVCTQLQNHLRLVREASIHAIIVEQDIHNRRSIDSFHESRGIFSVHCICHRLALVLTDAIKGSKSVIALLNSVYTYFARSATRKKAMRDMIIHENEYNKRQATQRLQREALPRLPDIVRQNPVEELEVVMENLIERHKLPRRIVLTRWLSCADAVKVVLHSRLVYINYFSNEHTDNAHDILESLEDSSIFAWFACMHDVLPVLTRMNVLFQSALPMPHILYSKITSAKATLINMVGSGGTRAELIPLASVVVNTSFGAYGNKFILDNSGAAAVHGTALAAREILLLKQSWHKLYAHCIKQIDSRFPPISMYVFQMMQVLDPEVVHGPLKRDHIGADDLAVVVKHLIHLFEIPLYTSGHAALRPEEIKNSFVVYRVSSLCADLWKDMTKDFARKNKTGQPFNYALVYPYYRQLLALLPELKSWALFALFLLVFPTGNAIAERGFSASGRIHTKERSELSREQVFANLIIGFNGPPVPEFAAQLDAESRQPNWPLYIRPNNFNM